MDRIIIEHDLKMAFDDGYQAGLEAAAPKWISVEDELPEVVSESNFDKRTEYVLAMSEDGVFCVGRFRIYKYDGSFEFASGYEKFDVTHWMKLPETPIDKAKAGE